ncbi:MAG: VWA domain-containing protein [Actinobacteria bacterium]|nr:VWA domain-containing protein [Actinomycetota bacterium]MBV8599896.1 VWA domain-containing protein [Actinomycetota bacterium]
MSFAAPILLLSLIAVPLAAFGYVWIERRREQNAARWANPALVPNLVHRPSPRIRHIPAILFLIGLTFLLLGVARPEAKLSTARSGATIILAVDKSGSMAANDVRPTRILAARNAIIGMLQKLPSNDRVALEVFDVHPYITVPPTFDRTKIEQALPTQAQPNGTDIGDAVEEAATVAAKTVGIGKGTNHPPATVVLLSDGAQDVKALDPSVAAKNARKLGVPVNTVLVGTAGGQVTQVSNVGGYPEKKTIPVPTDPSDLSTVAKLSGGRFFQAGTAASLLQVYADLGSHAAHTRQNHEVTAAAIGIALVFILAGVLVSGLWYRRLA